MSRILAAGLAVASVAAGSAALADSHTQTCRATNEAEIAALFEQWNSALQTGDPDAVVALYDDPSILLPTLSNTPRLTPETKKAYFVEFLQKKPVGKIDTQFIGIDCNTAFNAGTYTFTFGDGTITHARFTYTYKWNGERWLITSHHSSAMPEKTSAE